MDVDSFYADLLEFTKQRLECHGQNPANIINIVFKVFKTLKNQYRVTKCAKCHLFKNASTQCPNKECSKHMFIAQCKECKKTSVKNGYHNCPSKKAPCLDKFTFPDNKSDTLFNLDTEHTLPYGPYF